jgi:hypothetical protein
MNTNFVAVAAIAGAGLLVVGCETRTGQGAAVGAATGAMVGGPVGAAAGAVGGAIVGSTIGAEEARQYPAPSGGYAMAKPAGSTGMVYSPYTGKLYDVRSAPHGSLVLDTDAKKPFRVP